MSIIISDPNLGCGCVTVERVVATGRSIYIYCQLYFCLKNTEKEAQNEQHLCLTSRLSNFRNLLPDVDISLCGGLEGDNSNFSMVLFEQSKVTFDDFVLHLQV